MHDNIYVRTSPNVRLISTKHSYRPSQCKIIEYYEKNVCMLHRIDRSEYHIRNNPLPPYVNSKK